MALMLSGAMLLRHLGETEAGERLEAAVAGVIAEGRTVTGDLKPERDDPSAATTDQVRDAVIERLAA
jgi:isocitrate dehydrogenase (NAD+)